MKAIVVRDELTFPPTILGTSHLSGCKLCPTFSPIELASIELSRPFWRMCDASSELMVGAIYAMVPSANKLALDVIVTQEGHLYREGVGLRLSPVGRQRAWRQRSLPMERLVSFDRMDLFLCLWQLTSKIIHAIRWSSISVLLLCWFWVRELSIQSMASIRSWS